MTQPETLTPPVRRATSGTGTMKAAVFTGDGTMKLELMPLPVPGPSQVRLRLEGTGVCASNLPIWEGRPWFTYPLEPGAPGHEGWGVVDAVGTDVAHIRVGDRVAALSYHTFATHDVADEASVVFLPDQLKATEVPGEPLGCLMNIFARTDVQSGQTVAVVGVGYLGALLIMLLKSAGASVIGISRRAYALRLALEAGADYVFDLERRAHTIDAVTELTGGRLCDRVVEATGHQEPLSLAAELTRERGRLVVAGFHQDGPRQVDMQLWNWRGLDVINAHERDHAIYVQGMQEAVNALLDGRIDPLRLHTHAFPLKELPKAMQLMQARPDGFVKAMIRFEA